MYTPICDFVREYTRKNTLRLHMPGHKGALLLGAEPLDITEISGADSLYEADGIIAESEANAGSLFGCRTLYSTEGSSQCIRAMLYLILQYARQTGKKPLVAAGRNAHKTFLSAAALLDFDVLWLNPKENGSYLSCDLTADELDHVLKNAEEKPAAVYLTSPDYLGNTADIAAMAAVCHRYGVWLAVDNAHGAYLRFLENSLHPIDLGADLCCDSAHKTLPALTGAAYLHLSEAANAAVGSLAKNALALFGSTSPSYLILQSLDAVNLYLEDYSARLSRFLKDVRALKEALLQCGYTLYGNEPLKISVDAKAYGYTGNALAEVFRENNMEPEFADRDHFVLMLTPELSKDALLRVEQVFCGIPKRKACRESTPVFAPGERVLSIREAMLAESEILPVGQCVGRVLAAASVGCPPAVPILVCGERITAHTLGCFQYYGITECCVVK